MATNFNECIKRNLVKKVSNDINKIKSLKETAKENIESSDYLKDKLYYSKITLLYDALRKYLECLALENGYKIYNHECYSPFLKEKLREVELSINFNELRIIRNGINYYGRNIDTNESKKIIKDLKIIIKEIEKLLKKSPKEFLE